MKTKPLTKTLIAKLSILGLLASTFVPLVANAATGQLSPRSATLSTSVAGATAVTATFKFTPSAANSGATIKGIKFQMCNSPVETTTCTIPDGTSTMASATAGSESGTDMTNTYGSPSYNGATDVTFTNATGNVFNSGDGIETFAVQNITLPATANTEFYFRITTYNSSSTFNGATEVDYGGIAVSTAQQITITGTMPESLVFCVGTSGSNCGNITGSSVALGTFSPTSTNTGTSVMDVSTNAGSGYAITLSGTVPTSGSNTILAMGTQSANSSGCAVSCTSTTGTSQFGSNVRTNTSPSVGADVTPTGGGFNGAGSGGYNTPNSFRFFTGDTVAGSSQVSNAQLFTNSYLVNVAGSQAAGLYTATMTYICTATF